MKASMGEAVQVVGYIPDNEATLGRSKRPSMNERHYNKALFTRTLHFGPQSVIMFPVKGLSIAAEKLKVETDGPVASAPGAPKPARKRKRPGNTGSVTAENLSDLWDKVIEHKGAKKGQPKKRQKTDGDAAQVASKDQQPDDKAEKKQTKKDKKKEKRDSLATASEPAVAEEDEGEWSGIDDEEEAPEASKPVKGKADKKKEKKQKPSDGEKPKIESAPPAPPTPAGPKLTPLQASMREKLISARFRHLNETLYTRPSGARQTPLPRATATSHPPPPNSLPKAHDARTCVIADLGCGDAKLATTLQPLKNKLRLDLRSFDLQTGGSPLVTRADIANLPLADSSVDVAIFCLALMGTNWLSFVEEAYRILRWRGELWVAEIKSRFTNPDLKRKGAVVTHSVGNRKKSADPTVSKKLKAAQAEAEEEHNLADLAVHVDGSEAARKQETDIAAFVEALRKRGFLLNRDLAENAVDMGNKMFVRMHFVKAAPAIKGKCAATEEGAGSQEKRFITGDGEEKGGNEAGVLKPCVYKIR
ncbi:25S rRNA (adenine645-N1)-methyltransferase [Collariella sp. IMI 366227]|nr:25S rRNA (adenine645-N1)-methyltransferase [Collariella sp. IMI 366227]